MIHHWASMGALVLSVALAQAPSLAELRSMTQAVAGLDAAQLWAKRGPGLERQFGSEQRLLAFLKKVASDFGQVVRISSDSVSPLPKGGSRYTMQVAVTHWARGMQFELLTDDEGRLVRLAAQPAHQAVPSPHLEKLPQTELRVPFSGNWSVLWGGLTWEDNRHASVPDMRFALDLLAYAGKRTFTGTGTRNTDYVCWNREVLAPAKGVVVNVVDGIRDNDPNRIHSVESLYGNYVVIDHENGEYSLLAHLKEGSISVASGQRVTSGQRLAATGNSGMSTEPHLHYQLMDHPNYHRAHGLPVFFGQATHNGALEWQVAPRRGDTLAPSSAEARR
jgi:hypothetical protein